MTSTKVSGDAGFRGEMRITCEVGRILSWEPGRRLVGLRKAVAPDERRRTAAR